MIQAQTVRAVVVPVTIDNKPLAIQFGPGKEGKYPFHAALTFEILEGPDVGKKITSFLYFGEKQFDRNLDSLRFCGFKGDDLEAFGTQSPGQEVEIVISHESYNGKTSARVQWINAPGGSGGIKLEERLAPNALKRAAAIAKARLKAKPEHKGKTAVRGERAEREPGEDDGDPDPTGGEPVDDVNF